ncbi:MAG: Ig-like domain-containing protein, partial [Candidatus Latescibacterota bacterium]
AATGHGRSGDAKPRGAANSGPTRMYLFNMRSGGVYTVKKNGSNLTSAGAGPSGVISFSDDVNAGDSFEVLWTQDNPVDPPTPTGLQAAGNDQGCAVLSWDTPDPSYYVYEYVLAWGPSPGTLTDSATVSTSFVNSQAGVSTYTKCGLGAGHFCFVLRAHNSYDRWSGNSAEACTDVTDGDPQGLAAPGNVAVGESDFGCATVTWDAVGDPSVAGYVVYYGDRSVAGGAAAAYDDSVDAGVDTGAEICGFAAGTWYFAVKSYSGSPEFSPYSTERSLSMSGTDVTAPSVYSQSPADGATNVPTNASVMFLVADAQTGVDEGSIAVTINGAGVGDVSAVGDPGVYAVVARPAASFDPNATVNVEVTVSDRASPANQTTASWSFQTASGQVSDQDAPVITALSPANGAARVEPDSDIRVEVTDAGLGVDLASVEFYVNGAAVEYSVGGEPADLTLVYANKGGFSAGEEVSVRVVACDLASPANCAELSDYVFTVKSDFAAVPEDDMGEIVPNGFWANDPARPLEVRDMPAAWTVRIFDTAGRQVRTYTNHDADGLDWLWDFNNDHGQRVARSMYLVRVTDADGNVRQSGRFLVQLDP